jgi:hypothetical protein
MKFFMKVFVPCFCLMLGLCSSSMALGQLFLPRSALVGEPAIDFELQSYKRGKICIKPGQQGQEYDSFLLGDLVSALPHRP